VLDAAPDADTLEKSRALHRRGLAESSALRPVLARRLLRRALIALDAVRVGDSVPAVTLRMQILITLAKVESELQGSAVGLALLDEATELLDSGPAPEVVVALHNQRGVLMVRFGQWRRAVEEFDAAERFFTAAAPLERANVLLNRGGVALMLGELTTAKRDLQRCADVALAANLPLLQAMSLHNLGYLEFLLGDLPRALRLMDDSVDLLGAAPNTVGLLDRARVLAEAGLTREADESLARAAEIMRRDRSTQELGEAELERARCALVAGDIRSARRFAALARDRFRRRGNDAWRRTAEILLLQGDLAAQRPGRRLLEPALRLRAEFEAEGSHLVARTAALIATEAALAAGDPDAATRVFGSLGARRNDSITGRLHSTYVAARLAQGTGRPLEAARHVRRGLADLAKYQSSFGSIDLQTAAAVHGRRLAELGVAQALDQGRARAVFEAAERARAVSTRLPAVRPPQDEKTAELLVELRQTVESLRAVQQNRAELGLLRRRRGELERLIAARRWTLAGGGSTRPIAGLGAVSVAVSAADTTLVSYLDSRGFMHAVVIGRGPPKVVPVGPSDSAIELVRRIRADLDVLAQPQLPANLATAIRKGLNRATAELDKQLVAPLDVAGDRVVFVSTGLLGQVPWGLLPSLRAVPVVVASSATSWLAAHESRARSRRADIVAIAGPDLPRAQHEVAGVGAAWPNATVHYGTHAVRLSLTKAIARARVLHIAAHGVHQTENPLFSSLRLADGAMFAHELDQAARTPDHVILSACELGLATVRPGDEALGLTSVLLRLGTRSVVAGVARVADDVAAETMIDYHKRLASGLDSAAALAEATGAGAGIAPFVCFGSAWRARPSPRSRPRPSPR
jgi:CHAT domain-containing protein